ncbi:DUF6624 domain-containing protein [Christiangramia sediminis]|uniref:Uncharacterized protein n=1 Tax=Christiangramia sediminis TaxID=2881336 RepID=A0A9X1RZH2_9FLAO|nr:DUF6624 domain-containing protein [Christiangramia sediminis]MCB7482270.1 hypothetical protein [Christiangramia sediminis]
MFKRVCILSILLFSINSMLAQSSTSDTIETTLNSIWKSDQEIRFELIKLQQEGKMKSDEFQLLVEKMKKQDSLNLIQVKSILDNGWPDNLNMQANQTIFLVIQHADLQTQKQYLPIIKNAVEENKTLPSNLALLKDRINLREGKEQIYGSQVFIDSQSGKKYVQPLQNPEKIDSLRAEVGLPPMQVYLKQSFQMDWSLETYYHDLPEIKKLIEEKSK